MVIGIWAGLGRVAVEAGDGEAPACGGCDPTRDTSNLPSGSWRIIYGYIESLLASKCGYVCTYTCAIFSDCLSSLAVQVHC